MAKFPINFPDSREFGSPRRVRMRLGPQPRSRSPRVSMPDTVTALVIGRALRSTEGCQKKAAAYFSVVNKNRQLVCRQPKPNQVILLLHGPQPAPPRRLHP